MAPLTGPVVCKKKKKKGQRENPPVEKMGIMIEENERNMPRTQNMRKNKKKEESIGDCFKERERTIPPSLFIFSQ